MPFDYNTTDEFSIRNTAERRVLDRYAAEVEGEMEKVRTERKMKAVVDALFAEIPTKRLTIVKLVRMIFNLGLKEAKDFVDANHPIQPLPY